MVTSTPPAGNTINGMVKLTGTHSVSIVKWSGHDFMSISHSLMAQRRHHTRMPNKYLRERGLRHPRLSPLGLYQLPRQCCDY